MIQSFCICGQRIRCRTRSESAPWRRARASNVASAASQTASQARSIAIPPYNFLVQLLNDRHSVPRPPLCQGDLFPQTAHSQRVQRAMQLNSDSMDDPEE